MKKFGTIFHEGITLPIAIDTIDDWSLGKVVDGESYDPHLKKRI